MKVITEIWTYNEDGFEKAKARFSGTWLGRGFLEAETSDEVFMASGPSGWEILVGVHIVWQCLVSVTDKGHHFRELVRPEETVS